MAVYIVATVYACAYQSITDNWFQRSSKNIFPITQSSAVEIMLSPILSLLLVIACTLLSPSTAFSPHSSHSITRHTRLQYALSTSSVIDARSSLLSLLIDRRGDSESVSKNQQVRKIKECVAVLELAQSRGELTFPALWSQIDGDWTLKYSNNAGATIQSMAGLVLGPNNAMVTNPMLTVLQRINSIDMSIDHVLQLPNGSTITLKHDVAVTSDSSPAQLAIDLKEVLVDGKLVKNQTIKLPGPSFLRRGFFDVSILIQDLYQSTSSLNNTLI